MIVNKPVVSPLKRSRLGDEVYNAIYAMLMNHSIPPGGRLSVDRLGRELGVSQTPIREALSRLEAQGLVVKTHLVGYSAAERLDSNQLQQMYDLRLLLEPYAAAEAAKQVNAERVATLQNLSEKMASLGSSVSIGVYSRFAQLDGEFHDLIGQYSGNALVRDALARLHVHVHLFRLFYHERATVDAISEHAEIVRALVDGDPKQAQVAMHRHISHSRERFIKAFTV